MARESVLGLLLPLLEVHDTKSNSDAWQREKLSFSKWKWLKTNTFLSCMSFVNRRLFHCWPRRSYISAFRKTMIIFYSRALVLIFNSWCGVAALANQRFAHLTDNRATGSNNNNHSGQVQYPTENGFSRGVLSEGFLLLFFSSNWGFPRKMSVVLLSSEILLPHSFGRLPFACLYYFVSVLFYLFGFAVFGGSRLALPPSSSSIHFHLRGECWENHQTIFGRTNLVVELNK